MSLSVHSDIFGWNTISYRVAEPTRYGTDENWTIFTEWEGVVLQKWYMNKTVTSQHPFQSLTLSRVMDTFTERDDEMYKQAEIFAKDPTTYVTEKLSVPGEPTVTLPWSTDMLPPVDWGPKKANDKYLDDAETVFMSIDAEHVFYRSGEQARNVMIESDGQIKLLEAAFRHLGMDFRIQTGIKWGLDFKDPHYMKEVLQGFTIDIPADPTDEHNFRGHTISVDLQGLEIECGYVTDDKQWELWKGRQAADWLNDFEKETSQSRTYEDYEYKPDQSEVH